MIWGTKNIWSKCNLHFIFFSLASSIHVLGMNTTEGSFAQVKSLISFSVTRFPSPQQVHIMRLMAFGWATQQPPPLNMMKLRLPTLAFVYRESLRWTPCTCSLFSFFSKSRVSTTPLGLAWRIILFYDLMFVGCTLILVIDIFISSYELVITWLF